MTNEKVRIEIDEVHSTSVTVRRYRVNGSWFQFYDDNSICHQVSKLEPYRGGKDVWVHQGHVDVPKYPTDDEREDAYYRFLSLLHNGEDAY